MSSYIPKYIEFVYSQHGFLKSMSCRLKTVIEELIQTQQTLLSKEELVLELEKKIEESSKTCEKKSE